MNAHEYEILGVILYVGATGLVLMGAFALSAFRHLFRMVLGLALLEAGINLFLVAIGYRPGGAAPILELDKGMVPMVDPIAQALVLTAIVIGVGVLALALALIYKVHGSLGSLDSRDLSAEIARVGKVPVDPQSPVKGGNTLVPGGEG